MPRKPKFVPPFLQMSMSTEGVTLFRVYAQKGPTVNRFSKEFGAEIFIDPKANRAAIALTLVELAETLVRHYDMYLDEAMSEVCQALYLALMVDPDKYDETPKKDRDDLPW